MDTSPNDNFDELPSVETPEDVAVLYSWANLHGAKYRDFSASRREYRAQLRHRAAEQTRDSELRAQANAEAAANSAERSSREAEQAALVRRVAEEQVARAEALRAADAAAQVAAAERMEASRRAEAAAQAEATARREEREIAEASASARRQAALYAETESRRRRSAQDSEIPDVPGRISDPYTSDTRSIGPEALVESPALREPAIELHPVRYRQDRGQSTEPTPPVAVREAAPARTAFEESFLPMPSAPATPPRRPQGYRPDDASGVRQIYRGPENEPQERLRPITPRSSQLAISRGRAEAPVPPYATRETTLPRIQATVDDDEAGRQPRAWTPGPAASPNSETPAPRSTIWASTAADPTLSPATLPIPAAPRSPEPAPQSLRMPIEAVRRDDAAGQLEDPTPKRRRQDLPDYRQTDSDRAIAAYRREQARPIPYGNAPTRPVPPDPSSPRAEENLPPALQRPAVPAAPAVPAWIHGQQSAKSNRLPVDAPATPEAQAQATVSDTLQRSREKVASRWYALKGVFEQPGQDRSELEPVRQKETRTPVLAVFSLAGGVGKTSLVATLGRSLSSLGEKVLLTDTTSHGLLPFYFGASELRQGTVRTFSPPSGSTDAPIYMVNYAVDQALGDDAAQEALVEEIANSGRGAHRILLDLTSSTGWIVRSIARLNPTVLVPLAPDMNSVISLQAIEKCFHGVNGPDGAALKVFYVLNQFDASLPLHLDVREVLRRQLGERLLPIAIRRAPAVSEALAEGMTIVDYAADAPVAGDYMNIATWLRSLSAPATAGFRNVRWSER